MVPEPNQAWSAAGWGVAIVSAIGLIGVVLRNIGPWRKQISDIEEKLRAEMHSEIETLKATLKAEREEHLVNSKAEEILRSDLVERLHKLETQSNRQQIRHNAERALDRHRLNNINACFDSLLMLLRANPEKAAESVQLIEEMRARQILAEAEEKAIIRAAEIQIDGGEQDHDGN